MDFDVRSSRRRVLVDAGLQLVSIEYNNVGQLIHDLEQRVTEVLRVLVSSLQKMNARLNQIERANGK